MAAASVIASLGQIDLALNDFNYAMELDRTDPETAANLGDHSW